MPAIPAYGNGMLYEILLLDLDQLGVDAVQELIAQGGIGHHLAHDLGAHLLEHIPHADTRLDGR